MGLTDSKPAATGHLTVHCRLFAQYAEVVGVSALSVEIPSPASVSDAVVQLRSQLPNGHLLPQKPLVAVNREHALGDQSLTDGDELALLPPLAGG